MVFVTESVLSTVFAELLCGIASRIRSEWAWPSPEAGFAAFVFRNSAFAPPVPLLTDWPKEDLLVHAPSLAAAGYSIAIGEATDIETAWLDGVERLRGREPFASDRQSFAFRPLEILGVSAGISRLRSRKPHLVRWISRDY